MHYFKTNIFLCYSFGKGELSILKNMVMLNVIDINIQKLDIIELRKYRSNIDKTIFRQFNSIHYDIVY
jgi:hypothetical protein